MIGNIYATEWLDFWTVAHVVIITSVIYDTGVTTIDIARVHRVHYSARLCLSVCVCLSFNECTLGARWPPTFKPSQPALAVKQLSAASNVVICYCCSSIVSDILILQSCIVPHSLCMIRICADGSGFRFAPVWQFSVNWRDRDGCLLLSLFF